MAESESGLEIEDGLWGIHYVLALRHHNKKIQDLKSSDRLRDAESSELTETK